MLLGYLSPTILLSIPQAMTVSPPHRPGKSAGGGGTFTWFMVKPGYDHKFLGR